MEFCDDDDDLMVMPKDKGKTAEDVSSSSN